MLELSPTRLATTRPGLIDPQQKTVGVKESKRGNKRNLKGGKSLLKSRINSAKKKSRLLKQQALRPKLSQLRAILQLLEIFRKTLESLSILYSETLLEISKLSLRRKTKPPCSSTQSTMPRLRSRVWTGARWTQMDVNCGLSSNKFD